MNTSAINRRMCRWILPTLLAATLPAAVALAQPNTQSQASPPRAQMSADAIKRLQDGRFEPRAMLCLNRAIGPRNSPKAGLLLPPGRGRPGRCQGRCRPAAAH